MAPKKKAVIDEYVDIESDDEPDDGEESEGVVFERMMGMR